MVCLSTIGCSLVSKPEPAPTIDSILPGWSLHEYVENGMAAKWAESLNYGKGASVQSLDQRLSPTIVFIEGDGQAWVSRTVRSSNPTPYQPIAAQLAHLTSSYAKTLYLGRPCQFFDDQTLAGLQQCTSVLWTDNRYSSKAVAVMSSMLDEALDKSGQKIVLIGYSGGGVIAALLAAQRTDVYGLITVAANLDLVAWTAHNNVSQLPEALSPALFGAELSSVPQFHLHGARDTTVPRAVHEAYLAELQNDARIQTVYLDEYDHSCCWSRSWIDHLQLALAYFDANH